MLQRRLVSSCSNLPCSPCLHVLSCHFSTGPSVMSFHVCSHRFQLYLEESLNISCDLMDVSCSHEPSKFVVVSAVTRISTFLFHFPGHSLLPRIPVLWLQKSRKSSLRRLFGCNTRVLLVPSHGFRVLSSLFSRHGSQIQSTTHHPRPGAERVKTLVGEACEKAGLLRLLRLPREACFDQER